MISQNHEKYPSQKTDKSLKKRPQIAKKVDNILYIKIYPTARITVLSPATARITVHYSTKKSEKASNLPLDINLFHSVCYS